MMDCGITRGYGPLYVGSGQYHYHIGYTNTLVQISDECHPGDTGRILNGSTIYCHSAESGGLGYDICINGGAVLGRSERLAGQ
jgi:hypothetical protein